MAMIGMKSFRDKKKRCGVMMLVLLPSKPFLPSFFNSDSPHPSVCRHCQPKSNYLSPKAILLNAINAPFTLGNIVETSVNAKLVDRTVILARHNLQYQLLSYSINFQKTCDLHWSIPLSAINPTSHSEWSSWCTTIGVIPV